MSRPGRRCRCPRRVTRPVQAIAHATRLAAKGVPILVQGESGAGKLALARAVLDAVQVPAARVSVVDAASGGATRCRSSRCWRQELDLQPAAVVLRHLEALTPEAATATAALLEALEEQDHAPRVIATLTTGTPPGPGFRRLVDTVGVGRVTVPPLRDRHEDIGPAAVALLERHRGAKPLHFSSAALRCLMRAPWPGNLRQLDATVRGLVSTATAGEIRVDALPLELQGSSRKRELSAIEELELGAILSALQQHHGNKVAAAQSIGISRSTLYRKLQAYRLDPDNQ